MKKTTFLAVFGITISLVSGRVYAIEPSSNASTDGWRSADNKAEDAVTSGSNASANSITYGRAKRVGYAPEYQEALGYIQAVNSGTVTPTMSVNLSAAITAQREKLQKEGVSGAAEMTDLQVVESLVHSKASEAL